MVVVDFVFNESLNGARECSRMVDGFLVSDERTMIRQVEGDV